MPRDVVFFVGLLLHEMQQSATSSSEDDDDYDIPEDIEGVIEHMLTALKDKDTIVR